MTHLKRCQSVSSSWRALAPLWRILILLCLVGGIALRFVNFNKVFWYDEAFTMLRISGYTVAEVIQELSPQQMFEPAVFQTYRQVNPDRGVADTVRGLAIDEPQHTPLYFILARWWAGWFGSAVPTIRLLSVVFSLLAIPAMGWLCWELYGSSTTFWVGATLMAVSPFQLVYAQEARPTALWTLTTLLSCIALLRALRLQSAKSWTIYTVTLIASLYAFLLSGLVLVSHALYVLLLERCRWSKTVQKLLLAAVFSAIVFAPWLLVIAGNTNQVDTTTNWLWDKQLSILELLRIWAYHASLPFIDRIIELDPPIIEMSAGAFVIFTGVRILVLLIAIWSLVWLCRHTPRQTWLFPILLIVVPFVVLALPDLLGGVRSATLRYFVPLYLGLQLAMTAMLSHYLSRTNRRWWRQAVVFGILIAGLWSSTLIAQAPAWWNKGRHISMPRLAQQINQTNRPLVVVSNSDLGDLLTLSYYLDPKVRLVVKPFCYVCSTNPDQQNQLNLPAIPPGFDPVFLYNPLPTQKWLAALQQQQRYSIQTLSEVKTEDNLEYWLWQITP